MSRHRRHPAVVLVVLAFALIALAAVPAGASAVGFEVNGTGDGANQAECE